MLYQNDVGLWIGTKGNGLLNYHEGKLSSYQEILNAQSITAMALDKDSLWVSTEKGLHEIKNGQQKSFTQFNANINQPQQIRAIIRDANQTLLIGSKKGLFRFDKSTSKFSVIPLSTDQMSIIIFDFHKDKDENIWISSDAGVYIKDHQKHSFEPYKRHVLDFPIASTVSDDQYMWFGSLTDGIYGIEKSTDLMTHITHDVSNKDSLSSNYIVSLHLDDHGMLWISTFTGGINAINTSASKFGLHSSADDILSCATSLSINHFYQDKESNFFIGTDNELIKFNAQEKTCTTLLSGPRVNNITLVKPQQLWLATSQGLYEFSYQNQQTKPINSGIKQSNLTFIQPLNSDEYLIGSSNGLYIYDSIKKSSIRTSSIENNKRWTFYTAVKDQNSHIYLATNLGVAVLDENYHPQLISDLQQQLPCNDVLSVAIKAQSLYMGCFQGGIYRYDLLNHSLNKFSFEQISDDLSVHSLQIDDNNNIWAGTDLGIKRFDFDNQHVKHYFPSHGLQGSYFNHNAVYKDLDGTFYFGGRNGFNRFKPSEIKTNKIAPHVVLTNLLRFGKTVEPLTKDQDFYLNKPINNLDSLTLTHKDYVIGFEFAALDMSDPSRNHYQYQLEGFDPDWTHVNADNRRASYTNLPAGSYQFKVKAANKDGLWNDQATIINIKVLPAPWLTWWALGIYVLVFFSLIYWYWRKKNQESIRVTNMLKQQVAERTQQLEQQKNKVEQLLIKKNEMFTNVSHEFRTPLTLILGPINKLLKSPLHSEDKQSLTMVNRNANRLLTMIEQLLLLAKLSGEEQIKQLPQLIHHQILSIVEIFQLSAKEKNITLALINNNKAAINATPHTIDTILGNLLSNAIKYTPVNGKVSVNSYTTDDGYVCIEVKDNGCGLNKQQQKEIFNRFKRLDDHSDIDGVGIGLSVVEEVLKINNGQLTIDSEQHEGSLFTVKFATIDINDSIELNTADEPLILTNQLAKNAILQASTPEKTQVSLGQKNQETILIIEDNDDMRQHIADSLKSHYNCLLANRGKAGIALAIKHIPDIIICDVMMPEMDGFKVSRTVRSDSRTSHIPLILLTALHDKESRIKGWREHVDAYLTKPFDADELLLQLNNVLIIRNILKKKTGQLIKAGQQSSENIDLPKKDKEFIDKLNALIKENYKNPIYQRIQLASDMAVSVKQLQRKTKALIDKNPMELLREYRLQKAAEKLKEGYQVSLVSDQAGFNSVSHFSQCFKANFGITAKAYQMTCNEQTD